MPVLALATLPWPRAPAAGRKEKETVACRTQRLAGTRTPVKKKVCVFLQKQKKRNIFGPWLVESKGGKQNIEGELILVKNTVPKKFAVMFAQQDQSGEILYAPELSQSHSLSARLKETQEGVTFFGWLVNLRASFLKQPSKW